MNARRAGKAKGKGGKRGKRRGVPSATQGNTYQTSHLHTSPFQLPMASKAQSEPLLPSTTTWIIPQQLCDKSVVPLPTKVPFFTISLLRFSSVLFKSNHFSSVPFRSVQSSAVQFNLPLSLVPPSLMSRPSSTLPALSHGLAKTTTHEKDTNHNVMYGMALHSESSIADKLRALDTPPSSSFAFSSLPPAQFPLPDAHPQALRDMETRLRMPKYHVRAPDTPQKRIHR